MVDLSEFRGENGTVLDNAKRYVVDGTAICITASILFAKTSIITAIVWTTIICGIVITIMNRLRQSNELKHFASVKAENVKFLQKRMIDENYPRLKYRARDEKDKKFVIHFGQIKLLMSEVAFLTKYGKLANVVVYAGAAPGHHILSLARMFANHKFILYDECPFSESLLTAMKEDESLNDQITICNELITMENGKLLGDKYKENMLLISDIRTSSEDGRIRDSNIINDNNLMVDLCKLMLPVKSLLKFRLPYPSKKHPGPTKVLKGDFYFEAFNRRSSTETRLVPSDNNYDVFIDYDHTQYEEELFWFNEVCRKAKIENEWYNQRRGLWNNYDSWLYCQTIYDYLLLVNNGGGSDGGNDGGNGYKPIKEEIWQMSDQIMENLNCGFDVLRFRTNHAYDDILKKEMGAQGRAAKKHFSMGYLKFMFWKIQQKLFY